MTTQELADLVIDELIDKRGGGITFVEIRNFLSQHIEVKGHMALALGDKFPNVLLWADMSQEFVDVMYAIQTSGRVAMTATSYLTYMIDGGMLSMPLARAKSPAAAQRYKTEHWAPSCFWMKGQAPHNP